MVAKPLENLEDLYSVLLIQHPEMFSGLAVHRLNEVDKRIRENKEHIQIPYSSIVQLYKRIELMPYYDWICYKRTRLVFGGNIRLQTAILIAKIAIEKEKV